MIFDGITQKCSKTAVIWIFCHISSILYALTAVRMSRGALPRLALRQAQRLRDAGPRQHDMTVVSRIPYTCIIASLPCLHPFAATRCEKSFRVEPENKASIARHTIFSNPHKGSNIMYALYTSRPHRYHSAAV